MVNSFSFIRHNNSLLSLEKEFEPDKHCGVWMPDSAKNCTRSLTCKVMIRMQNTKIRIYRDLQRDQ